MAQSQKTVLQIINAAQQELGLPVSSSVFGNPDVSTVQLLALLQLANEDLVDANDDGWSNLQTEFNLVVNVGINTTGTTIQNSAVITGIPDTSKLAANFWYVQGLNIPQGARILSVDSHSQITMTMESVGSQVGATISFAQDTYPLPSDIRFYINDTWWDRTNRWCLLGPDSPQLDQFHRSGIVATGPRRHFRTLSPFSNQYRIWPPPTEIVEPVQLVFEYVSRNSVSVLGSQVNFAESFANDIDQPLMDARALIMAIKWRFWEQKGLNWTSKRDEYDTFIERLMARDNGGNEKLNLSGRVYPYLISPFNVQDGYFPGGGNGGASD